MKRVFIVIGAVIVAAALAAGSFYGGMAYQRNQTDQIRNNFLRSRGIATNGGAAGQGRGFFGGGGGATGQVKSINGEVLTLSTAQNVTTVNLSSSTRVEKAGQASVSDLQPGTSVLVTGQRDSNGNINASQVLILGDLQLGPSRQQGNTGGQGSGGQPNSGTQQNGGAAAP